MTVTAVGSLVRLKAGVKLTETGSSRLKPGELATITEFRDMDNEMFLKRQRDGKQIMWSRRCSSSEYQTSWKNDFELAPE